MQITPVTLAAGNYLLAMNHSVATTLRTVRGGLAFVYYAMGSSPLAIGTRGNRTAAAFTSSPTTPDTWVAGANGSQHSLHLRWKAAT